MDEATDPFADFLASLEVFWTSVASFIAGVVNPGWRQNQVLIVSALALIAWLLHGRTGNMLQDWVRTREGWAKWQLRMIVVLRRRLGLIWFAVIALSVYFVMQNITWPSRSYLIGLAATLAVVWVGIAFAAQLVNNRPIRRIVKWSLWIYATLYLLNVSDSFAQFLDSLALELGEFRLSMLSLITALVVVGFFSRSPASPLRRPPARSAATKRSARRCRCWPSKACSWRCMA